MNEIERVKASVAVLDILAPRYPQGEGERFPIFEWPKETTPTAQEMAELALQIVDAVRASFDG
jgi:hypothetical protein